MSNLDSYMLYQRDGDQIPRERRLARWIEGLGRTIGDIPRSVSTIILGDTPYPGIDVPQCLQHQVWIDACQRDSRRTHRLEVAAAERQLASETGVAYASLETQVCPYRPCPIIVDQLLVYRDHSHMTATYARALGPSLRHEIVAAIAGTPTSRRSP